MRTHIRTLLFALIALPGLSGCGKTAPAITVMGQTLTIRESNVGHGDYFCKNLHNGQYQIVITDFFLCDKLKMDMSSKTLFHGDDETNVRIIFSDFLLVPPNVNMFKVAPDPGCDNGSANPQNAEAVFIFSHASKGRMDYDYQIQAESGSVTVISTPDQIKTQGQLKINYDITILGQHLSAEVDALTCPQIVPGIGL